MCGVESSNPTPKFLVPVFSGLPRRIATGQNRATSARVAMLQEFSSSAEQCRHSIIRDCSQLSNILLERSWYQSMSCLFAAKGGVGATTWHALLPSCHFSDRECISSPMSQSNTTISGRVICNGLTSSSELLYNNSSSYASIEARRIQLHQVLRNISAKCQRPISDPLGFLGCCNSMNLRLSVAARLSEGYWNATWDVRPARSLHGRHSAWLFFGVCTCFANLNPANTEAILEGDNDGIDDASVTGNISHGKKVYTDYSVTGIPGDGRCLFRAVAHGACFRSGKPIPNENEQRKLADELRERVADEFLKRRKETEWFVEGDFDIYVKQIRKPHVWGGEPELLMASHVLQMPITVYMEDRNCDGLIAIAEYGQDYGKENPIRVLYHGFGHYDALQIPKDGAQSKL